MTDAIRYNPNIFKVRVVSPSSGPHRRGGDLSAPIQRHIIHCDQDWFLRSSCCVGVVLMGTVGDTAPTGHTTGQTGSTSSASCGTLTSHPHAPSTITWSISPLSYLPGVIEWPMKQSNIP